MNRTPSTARSGTFIASRRSVLLGGASLIAAVAAPGSRVLAASPGSNPGKYKADLGGYIGPKLSDAPMTLRVLRQEFSPEINAPIRAAYTAFKEAYPNITIEEERIPYGDLAKKVQLYVASGSAPDIMMGSTELAPVYSAGKIAVPLNDYFSQDFIQDIYAPLRESATIDGKVMCLAWESNSSFLYFNRDIFKRAGVATPPEVIEMEGGWTADQYINALRAITEKARKSGDQATFGLASSRFGNRGPGSNYSQLESMWVRMMGDPRAPKDSTAYKTFAGISENGQIATGYLDTPEAIKGMTNYQTLFKEDLSPKGIVADQYKGGVAATDFSSMAFANTFRSQGAPFDWGVSPPLRGAIGFASNVADAPFIYSGSPHIPEAAALLAFLLNDTNRRAFYAARGSMPSRQSLTNEMPEYKSDPVNMLAANVAAGAYGPPKSVGWLDYVNAVNPAVKDIALGVDVADRLHTAARQVDRLLVKYR
ncbi:extracellular solute-binding protein [Alsobacter sp. SYSU M60028]|uniref:Extracellular solute-binding protein n=1 Tax=Alsobacter ponti TaxID=2962936 RepID=A0ABT1L7H4_9HYPH|nr:extracellular solute-binding protein [Alsobacter ponti]MCP8937422.1 extracellular solute-binding protein [Alsobacter ponti]